MRKLETLPDIVGEWHVQLAFGNVADDRHMLATNYFHLVVLNHLEAGLPAALDSELSATDRLATRIVRLRYIPDTVKKISAVDLYRSLVQSYRSDVRELDDVLNNWLQHMTRSFYETVEVVDGKLRVVDSEGLETWKNRLSPGGRKWFADFMSVLEASDV